MSEEQAAAEQYVTQLKALFATSIVPGLRGGILHTEESRPPVLTVEVTDEPSPYSVGAKVDADRSLTVRLSLGYLMMHDSALDAVALSAVAQRPLDLRRYLFYQLRLARENYWRRVAGATPQHVMNFAEFVGFDPKAVQKLYAQRSWQESRNRVEVASLGWVIAYLLIRADAKLGRVFPLSASQDSTAAAYLAGSSGWFPVPPFATALQLAEITRTPTDAWDERTLLCRAVVLMEGGIAGLRAEAGWSKRLDQDAELRNQVAEIRSQITVMRLDGGCAPAEIMT